jgi:hypothetical protein
VSAARPSSASIDELLGSPSADEPPRPSASGDSSRLIAKGLFAAALLTAVGMAVLKAARLAAPLWFVFAVACALVAVVIAVGRVRPPLPARAAGRHHAHDAPADGLRHAVRRWESRLDSCHGDTAAFHRKVLPALGELVDERLRQRHGITRAGDPARARALLGESLWTFLAGPVRRPPDPRELANLIAWMERI